MNRSFLVIVLLPLLIVLSPNALPAGALALKLSLASSPFSSGDVENFHRSQGFSETPSGGLAWEGTLMVRLNRRLNLEFGGGQDAFAAAENGAGDSANRSKPHFSHSTRIHSWSLHAGASFALFEKRAMRVYVRGGAIFRQAQWRRDMVVSYGFLPPEYRLSTNERAKAQRVGAYTAAGLEIRLGRRFSLLGEAGATICPLSDFSGTRDYHNPQDEYFPVITYKGTLYSAEIWNGREWTGQLEVGERPVGPGSRGARPARLAFSGLVMRLGLIVRI